MKTIKKLPLELFRKHFIYEPLAGLLYRKMFQGKECKPRLITPNKHRGRGYPTTSINQKDFLYHRICYAMHHNRSQFGIIDHINSNRTDSRADNLREISNGDNIFRAGIRKNNSSGVTGVSFNKKTNTWSASICCNWVKKGLGTFKTKHAAVEARKDAELKRHSESLSSISSYSQKSSPCS